MKMQLSLYKIRKQLAEIDLLISSELEDNLQENESSEKLFKERLINRKKFFPKEKKYEN